MKPLFAMFVLGIGMVGCDATRTFTIHPAPLLIGKVVRVDSSRTAMIEIDRDKVILVAECQFSNRPVEGDLVATSAESAGECFDTGEKAKP